MSESFATMSGVMDSASESVPYYDDGLRMPAFDPADVNLRAEIESEIRYAAGICAIEGREPTEDEILAIIRRERYTQERRAERQVSLEDFLAIAADVLKEFEPPVAVGTVEKPAPEEKRAPWQARAEKIESRIRRSVSQRARALLRSSRPRSPSGSRTPRATSRAKAPRAKTRTNERRGSDPPAPAEPPATEPNISITRFPATDAQVRRWLDAISRFLIDGDSGARGDS